MAAEQTGKGSNKQQTVKPVQNAAVAGEQSAVILHTKAPLDGRHGKIAELADNGGGHCIQRQLGEIHLQNVCLFQHQSNAKQKYNALTMLSYLQQTLLHLLLMVQR